MGLNINNSTYPAYTAQNANPSAKSASNAASGQTATAGTTAGLDVMNRLDDEVILSDAAADEAPAPDKAAVPEKWSSAAQYRAYLKDKYACVDGGNVTLATGLLDRCVNDSAAAKDLELYLAKIPEAEKIVGENAKARNATVLRVNWAFDKEGRLSSVTVLQNRGSETDMKAKLVDTIGKKSNAGNDLLGLLQAQFGTAAGAISVQYSDAGTSAVAAASAAARPGSSVLDFLA